MSNQFDVLADDVTKLVGWDFVTYAMFDDAPEEKEINVWKLLGSVLAGLAVVAVVVAVTVATLGVGTAVIAGVVGTAVVGGMALTDSKNGEVREWYEYAGAALISTVTMALAAASVVVVPAVMASSSISVPATYLGYKFLRTGTIATILNVMGYTVTGANALFTANRGYALGTGNDILGNTLFKDNPDLYRDLQIGSSYLSYNILAMGANSLGNKSGQGSNSQLLNTNNKSDALKSVGTLSPKVQIHILNTQ